MFDSRHLNSGPLQPPKADIFDKLTLTLSSVAHSGGSPEERQWLRDTLSEYSRLDGVKEPRSFDVGGTLFSSTAAACLSDWPRTTAFLRAIDFALNQLRETLPHGSIFAVDAGCGPFALLALSIVAFEPRAQVLALESNRKSVACATSLVERLNLGKRVQVVHADCTTFVVPQTPHLLVSETFDNGLQCERGLQILDNLACQVHPQGLAIPSGLQVQCTLSSCDSNAVVRDTRLLLDRSWQAGTTLDEYRAQAQYHNLPRGTYHFGLKNSYSFPAGAPPLTPSSGSAIALHETVATFAIMHDSATVLVELVPGMQEVKILSPKEGAVHVINEPSMYRRPKRYVVDIEDN